MLGKEKLPSSRNSLNEAEHKKLMKANNNKFTLLTLSATVDKDIDAVADGIITEYETGCLKMSWDNLNKYTVSKSKLI